MHISLINTNFVHSVSLKNNKKQVYNVTFNKDNYIENDYYETLKKQNDKINKTLKFGVTGIYLAIIAGIVTAITLTSAGRHSAKQTKNCIIKNFESLANNNEIPTIYTCKSLDKNLKKFLTDRINFIKAPQGIKDKIGKNKDENLLLLYGPPGNGKTFFGKIFAKSIDADFMEIKFADYNSQYAGEDIEHIQSLFDNIITNATANPDKKFVVVYNEIDAAIQPLEHLINGRSGHLISKIEERSTIINYIDEIKDKLPNVTIIGTTNQSPMNNGLDGAILSRFKNIIKVDYPQKNAIIEALKYNLEQNEATKNILKSNIQDIEKIAETMEKRKCSFRDVNNVIEISKNNYLNEYVKSKTEYKIKYLKDAINKLQATDGELSGAIKKGDNYYESKSYFSKLWKKITGNNKNT